MSTIYFNDKSFRVDREDAQMLALVAARFTAAGESFTIRVGGSGRTTETWLTVTPGVAFRVVCDPIEGSGQSRLQLDDRVDESLDVAKDRFNIVAVGLSRG